jgi:DNA-binding CsgD family transcriptional regulator/transcriptional regulator with XRE-family HTH domain
VRRTHRATTGNPPSRDEVLATPEGRAAYAVARLPHVFYEAIADRMKATEVSQAELARRMGVTEGRVSQILSGDQSLTLRTLAKVSAALDASFEVRLVRHDEQSHQPAIGLEQALAMQEDAREAAKKAWDAVTATYSRLRNEGLVHNPGPDPDRGLALLDEALDHQRRLYDTDPTPDHRQLLAATLGELGRRLVGGGVDPNLGLALLDRDQVMMIRRDVEALAGQDRGALGISEAEPSDQPVDPVVLKAAITARYGLSTREFGVWLLLVEGLTNKQIGERLFISDKTVVVHLASVMRKLDVRSRVQAITLADQLGLLTAT